MYRSSEPVGDLGQRGRRCDRQSQVLVDVTDKPVRVLQLRHIHVEEHPVDAFDLEGHVLGEDIGDVPGYGHHRLRSEIRRPTGQPLPQRSSYTRPALPSRVILPDRSPNNATRELKTRWAGAQPR